MDKFEQVLVGMLGELMRDNGSKLIRERDQQYAAHADRLRRFGETLQQIAAVVAEEERRFANWRQQEGERQTQVEGPRQRALEGMRQRTNSGAEAAGKPAN